VYPIWRGHAAWAGMRPKREALLAYACLLPSAVLVVGIILYPILRTFVAAFCELDDRGAPVRFGSVGSFRALFGDDVFVRRVVPQSLLWTGSCVALTLLIALVVAVLLNERVPGRRAARAIVMLPWASSLMISAVIWRWMLDPRRGAVNQLLRDLGLGALAPAWLARGETALPAVIAVGVWVSIPFTAVVLLAGLQAIPEELYEAALMDGATPWQRFRLLTLPLLRPVLTVAVLLNVIYVFNSFPIIWTLTEGGPANRTHIVVTYLYKMAFDWSRYGEAYAMAVLTFAFLLLFSVLYTRVHARGGLSTA